jgi:hypothetical protein
MQVKIARQNKPSDDEVFIALRQVDEKVLVALQKPEGTDIPGGYVGTFIVEGGKLTFRLFSGCNTDYVNKEAACK